MYLLADVFENFRSAALSTYGLDPAHYFTLPGFSWDALLKTTDTELQLFTVVDKHLFIERGKSCVHACVCDYIFVADWLKILVVDWLFTLEHSRHFYEQITLLHLHC